ncbi:MAG: ABC transporter permease [Fimbriimonadaceae bacterium]|nr:ABC transporter permease [Fimbriimonadaceae bacterium]
MPRPKLRVPIGGTVLLAASVGWHSLLEHWRRTVLSALGVLVGTLAVVLLISVAKGVQRSVTQQIEDLGVNLLIVLPTRIQEGSMFSPNLAGISYLSEADVAAVRQVPGVRLASPLMFVGGAVRVEERISPSTFAIAAQPEWFSIRPVELSEGRTFGPEDAGRPVCVIGSLAKGFLFGAGPALGKTIEVAGTEYKIVGVTVDKSAEGDDLFSMGGFENIAYVPYDFVRDHVPNPQVHRIMIQTAPDREPKSLVAAVESALSERLDRDMFSVLTQRDLLKLVFQIMDLLTWLLTGLTSIGLFVGGVGIMVVMLMMVNERAKEIGIRKAVGARRRDVFLQFVFESGAIGLLGGGLGVALSALVGYVLAQTTPIKPILGVETIALGFAVSVGVGMVFGLVPAMRASAKDPVASLRNES